MGSDRCREICWKIEGKWIINICMCSLMTNYFLAARYLSTNGQYVLMIIMDVNTGD